MDRINYDKLPFTSVEGSVYTGWNKIENVINKRYKQLADTKFILVIETYQGVYHEELIAGFNQLQPELFVDTKELFLSEDSIRSKTHP
ncbi:Mannose-6-phosphate isomerase ManA, partial [termite gut metagenome]